MLTKKQIQRLAIKHDHDEEWCEELVRSTEKYSEAVFNAIAPKNTEGLFKEAFKEKFFEDLIRMSYGLVKQIRGSRLWFQVADSDQ